MTAEYTKTREQFDRPIATFQAVGQRAADAYIDTEAIRLTAWQAIWRLSEGLPATAEVAVAKFWAAEGGQRVVHAAQHLHGGMGVDRDYPLHRYFLWAKQLELTLGGATPQLLKLGAILAAEPVAERSDRHPARWILTPNRSAVVEHDGPAIAALDWGGDGEPLLLLHPNGFCAGFFDPLARRAARRFRPIGVDLRGHGATDAPDDPDGTALRLHGGRRGSRVLDALGVDEFVALGESLGGGVATLVDRPRAGRDAAPDAVRGDRLRPPGDRARAAAADAAAARTTWPRSRASAGRCGPTARRCGASYGSRPPLDVLAPESLDAYVRWGFVDRPDGQVELACPPETEAAIFEMRRRRARRPRRVEPPAELTAPAVVLRGDRSDLPMPWFAGPGRAAPARDRPVPGGHFFLQEDTARAEALVRAAFGSISPMAAGCDRRPTPRLRGDPPARGPLRRRDRRAGPRRARRAVRRRRAASGASSTAAARSRRSSTGRCATSASRSSTWGRISSRSTTTITPAASSTAAARSRSATAGSCRRSSTATATSAAAVTGTSCAASTCSGTAATSATSPLGLPPANWPEHHTGTGELPDAWPTWHAFWQIGTPSE